MREKTVVSRALLTFRPLLSQWALLRFQITLCSNRQETAWWSQDTVRLKKKKNETFSFEEIKNKRNIRESGKCGKPQVLMCEWRALPLLSLANYLEILSPSKIISNISPDYSTNDEIFCLLSLFPLSLYVPWRFRRDHSPFAHKYREGRGRRSRSWGKYPPKFVGSYKFARALLRPSISEG